MGCCTPEVSTLEYFVDSRLPRRCGFVRMALPHGTEQRTFNEKGVFVVMYSLPEMPDVQACSAVLMPKKRGRK